MMEQLGELIEQLPKYLGGHVLLSLVAMAAGLLLSLPLGISASRRPKLAEWALGVAGVVQTVPSLALLALMVLVLAGRIGFLPAFVALTLYSILPILANTITGIRGVDPSLVEAARGLGMNERQVLWRVQLPLAAPVIIAGIRTSTVLVVGTATLVTPVGGESLGNYIFGGLESINHVSTVFGCVMAALLAIVLDQLIRLLETAARKRNRRLGWAGLVGLLVVVAGGLFGPVSKLFAGGGERVVVASGPFTEQHILDGVLTRRLEEAGIKVDQRLGMSEGIQFQALFHNQADCIVNYTGNVWALLMKRTDFKSNEETLEEVRDYLLREHGVVCLGSLGFENPYVIAMRGDQARELDGSLDNLAQYVARYNKRTRQKLRIGGDTQIFDRPEWKRLLELYGINKDDFETRAMDPTLMYGAVKDGEVQAIVAYYSDGRIPAYKLEVLKDPRRAFPPYDAVLLLSPAAGKKPGVRQALEPLVGSIRLEMMRKANHRVDVEKWPARLSAEELLQEVERNR
jgi:osmoprotectant transport system permease protein